LQHICRDAAHLAGLSATADTCIHCWFGDTGSERSFKLGGQEWGLGQTPGDWTCGAKPPEADNTFFVKMCYFVVILGMTSPYLHSLPTSVQYEMEGKVNFVAEKWYGKQQCVRATACPAC